MSFYLNTGCYIDNQRCKTKRRLRESLRSDPNSVYFDVTSVFSDVAGYKATELPKHVKLSVCLPDPYHDRRTFATVQRTLTGFRVT